MGRVRSRIEKLEDRRTVRHERREERDERGEGTAAVMVRVRSTLEGRAAEEDLAGRLRGHGGVVGLLGAEGVRRRSRPTGTSSSPPRGKAT